MPRVNITCFSLKSQFVVKTLSHSFVSNWRKSWFDEKCQTICLIFQVKCEILMNHFLCIKKKKIKILTFFYFFLAFGRLSSSEESQKMENFDFENINISFNGCGFLGIYHVGVACALNYYLPNMKYKNICGASAGAMAATCLISKVPLGKEKKKFVKSIP